MRPDARLVSLELNEFFVEENRRLGDRRLTLVQGCAGDLGAIARDLHLGPIDVIVSSLPLAIMDDDLVERIVRESDRLLKPGGLFLQYQYSLSQRGVLERRFREVRVGFTLANIPPAFVYECTQGTQRARRMAAR